MLNLFFIHKYGEGGTDVLSPRSPSSLLKKSGSGLIFGETTSFPRKSLAENLDLTPSFYFFNRLLAIQKNSGGQTSVGRRHERIPGVRAVAKSSNRCATPTIFRSRFSRWRAVTRKNHRCYPTDSDESVTWVYTTGCCVHPTLPKTRNQKPETRALSLLSPRAEKQLQCVDADVDSVF